MSIHARLLLLLQLRAVSSSRYGVEFVRKHMEWVEAVKRGIAERWEVAPQRPPHVFLLDVGANNGIWGGQHQEKLSNLTHANIKLCMFEPQRRFHDGLKQIAQSTGGTLVPKAAWVADTELTLHGFGVSASLTDSWGAGAQNETVKAIDLARFLLEETPTFDLVIMKLDIEGAEYKVLPRLLISGALCRVDYLQIEWHLKMEAASGRLDALILRHSIDSLLRSGCANAGPRSVLHDEGYNNGYVGGFVHVPGIASLASRYSKLEELVALSQQKKPGR